MQWYNDNWHSYTHICFDNMSVFDTLSQVCDGNSSTVFLGSGPARLKRPELYVVGLTGLTFSVTALLLSIFTLVFLLSSSVSLSFYILAVPMRECSWEQSCMSSSFPIAMACWKIHHFSGNEFEHFVTNSYCSSTLRVCTLHDLTSLCMF